MNILSLFNNDLNFSKNINFNNKFISIFRDCKLKHWDPYLDKQSNIKIIILGRPIIDVDKWKNYKQSEKSFISKILIKKYIELELNEFCKQLNGAFSILILDYNFNKLIMITDKLGIYPIYIYGSENFKSFQFSSNITALINNIDQDINIDLISAAEFLKKGFIYHPNTIFNEIKTFDNGSYMILDFENKKIIKKKYFKIEANPIYNFNLLANNLSKALLKSIERRTLKHFGKKGIFLSGGSDSRMILANSADRNLDAITLYSEDNHELKVTKSIAKTLDVNHILIKRDKDYYLDSFDSSIRINGGRSLPIDDHFYNLSKDLNIKKYDSILTGCYADWIFKGIALNRKQVSILKYKLPLYKLKKFSYNFFSKRTQLKKKYEEKIKEREDQIFLDKNSHLNCEIVRIFPLFQEETSATRLTLQQLFPWDSIFSDNDVIKVYSQIPADFKLNSELYDKAVSKNLQKVKNIPHANKRHKIGINKYLGATLYVISIIKNKLLKLIRIKNINSVAGEGSWINFKEYARNKEIKDFWDAIENTKLFQEILNFNKESFNEVIKNDYNLIYKCITLDKVLKQKKYKFSVNNLKK